MSTTSTFPTHALRRAIAQPDHGTGADRRETFLAGLGARFFRFLEKLPETRADIDMKTFKRLPMPF